MLPFEMRFPKEESNAVKNHNAASTSKYIAGGTTLVDLMKLHVETPQTLLDLGVLPMKEIREDGSYIRVEAMVTNNAMAENPLIEKNFPVLSQALLSAASPQLRNLATAGGNLLQRTRCPYFRDTTYACNKRKPGSGCAAIDGFNRSHAVLGTSAKCIATYPGDMAVALIALDAKVETLSANGKREIPLTDFFKLPGETPHIETGLQPGELITAILIKKESWVKNSKYVKIRDRASYAFALSSVALALDMSGKKIRQARVAFGGIATVPWRSAEAESALQGKTLSLQTARDAAHAALANAKGFEHNKFKIAMAEQTLVRALHELGGLS